jgi:hypothetical protein
MSTEPRTEKGHPSLQPPLAWHGGPGHRPQPRAQIGVSLLVQSFSSRLHLPHDHESHGHGQPISALYLSLSLLRVFKSETIFFLFASSSALNRSRLAVPTADTPCSPLLQPRRRWIVKKVKQRPLGPRRIWERFWLTWGLVAIGVQWPSSWGRCPSCSASRVPPSAESPRPSRSGTTVRT